jgi:hypothetical protein
VRSSSPILDASTTIRTGYAQPALLGGLVIGVLSALPIINALNLCCCLWVVSGGLVGAYLLQQNQTAPITAGDGALVGLLAGIIGALVMFVLSIPIGLILAPMERAIAQRVLDMSGTMPPDVRQMLEGYNRPRGGLGLLGQIVVRAVWFVIFLVVGSIFSTLGGLLGSALFGKRFPQPGAMPPTV